MDNKKYSFKISFNRNLPIFLVCLLSFFSCVDNDSFRIEIISYRQNIQTPKDKLNVLVQDTKILSQNLVNSYLSLLKKEINPAFYNSFLLKKKKSFKVYLLISKDNETIIYIFPFDQSELVVDYTEYPIQLAMFGGLVDLNSEKGKTQSYSSDFISIYNTTKGVLGKFNGSRLLIGFYGDLDNKNPQIIYNYPKFISLSDASSAIIYGITFTFEKNAKSSISTEINGIMLINGNNNFSWVYDNAEKIGKEIAESEIKNFIERSNFFKLSEAHKRIKPKIDEIYLKRSREIKDVAFDYPLWQYLYDINQVKQMAKNEGIDVSYVNELLKNNLFNPNDGVLLWYYNNLNGFMLQWILINSIILILLIFLSIFNKIIYYNYKRLSLSSVIIVINGWIFYSKPNSLSLKFWLLPGFIFLMSIGVIMICNQISLIDLFKSLKKERKALDKSSKTKMS